MSEYKDDIEKYLAGTLSNAERHQLEKKALSDPFLAEALEGAEPLTRSEFAHDLIDIQQRISIQKRNSFFWPLRIAAAILVIISITVVTIKFVENNADNQLALQKQNSPSENLASPNKVPAPSYSEQSAPLAAQNQATATESKKRLPNQPTISQKPQASPMEEPVTNTDALSSAAGHAEQEMKESERAKEISSDEIAEQEAEFSKALESDDKKTAVTPSKNDRAAVSPSATRSLSLNKKMEAASGAGIAKDDAQAVATIEPLPVEGMVQFNKYVEDNLRYPQRAVDANIQGDVVIEFQINANGSYRNFKIMKSLGFGCDEEAIRLIQDGPKWTPLIQNGKVIDSESHVTIPFRIKKTGNE